MSAADFPADLPRLTRTGSVLARARTATDRGNGWRRLVVGAGLAWLPIAAALVAMTGMVYVTVQQSLRSGANDPQIQIAGDLAAQLAGGADPGALLGTAKVDLATSLSPYAIVFDDAGRPLASTGVLDGTVPVPPAGVLRAATQHRNELTWQPRSGVRSAIVVVPFHAASRSGTVLAGRSLREVEKREDFLFWAAGASLAGGLGITALACLAVAWLRPRLLPAAS
jgi:hypothetical protein